MMTSRAASLTPSDIFIDTNVLIHSGLASSPRNAAARRAIKDREDAGMTLWVSRQILREYLAALTRPQSYTNPLPKSEVIRDVRHFEGRFKIAEDGPDVTRELLRIIAPMHIGGKRIHDANIVATMLAYGITHVLTENTSDFDSFKRHISIIALQS